MKLKNKNKRYRYITGASFGSMIAAAIPMVVFAAPGPITQTVMLVAFLFGFFFGMATVDRVYPIKWE